MVLSLTGQKEHNMFVRFIKVASSRLERLSIPVPNSCWKDLARALEAPGCTLRQLNLDVRDAPFVRLGVFLKWTNPLTDLGLGSARDEHIVRLHSGGMNLQEIDVSFFHYHGSGRY
jgi:hypothetical protein